MKCDHGRTDLRTVRNFTGASAQKRGFKPNAPKCLEISFWSVHVKANSGNGYSFGAVIIARALDLTIKKSIKAENKRQFCCTVRFFIV